MGAFLKSDLYRHFWIFIIKTGLSVGFFSSFGMVVLSLMGDRINTDFAIASAYIFLIGFAFGFFYSIPGYWLIFGLARLKLPIPFNVLVILVGLLMGFATLYHFSNGHAFALLKSWQSLLFPILPLFLTIACAVSFSQKHLRPYLNYGAKSES